MILSIALPVPIDSLFDYGFESSQAGEHLPEDSPEIGARVRVKFGNRELIGLIVEVKAHTEIDATKLKNVIEVLDDHALLDTELIDLGTWAAGYYQHPLGDALIQLMPTLARKHSKLERPNKQHWVTTAIADVESLSKRAVKQRALLSFLINQSHPVTSEKVLEADFSRLQLKELQAKGMIEEVILSDSPNKTPSPDIYAESVALSLNSEQKHAVDQINRSLGFATYLLAGVTGSGKTEVYFHAIADKLREGKQALVIVPEIGLTPQLMERFNARFNTQIVCLHSGLSDRARFDAWQEAKSGEAKIIIGTRSSIFVPLPNPGIILIDEEHDSSLKQQDGFRYNARDLAVLRAQRLDIPLILGSATPSLESLKNAKEGRYTLLELNSRAGNAVAPTFRLVDIRHQSLDNGLSNEVIASIKQHLAAGNQALVFINRRGFSPSLVCNYCGSPVDCIRCDAHMTLHRKPARLHCHHCDRQTPIPKACNQCGCEDLQPSGTGTERLEARLESLFSDTPIHRVDRDTTYSKSAFDNLMNKVNQGEPCILVGTQMLAKGHHFPSVTLVCIINADAGLFSSDFRGMERMAQLTLQVAGRAGREQHPGTVLLQTMNIDHPVLQTLIEQGYMNFATEELTTRRLSHLPPYSFQITMQAEAKRAGWAETYLLRVRQYLDQHSSPDLFVSGPYPNTMERRAGFFRSQMILSSKQRPLLQAVARNLRSWIGADKESSRVRLIIDVDPIDSY